MRAALAFLRTGAAALCFAAAATAQTPPPASTAPPLIEEIVVTGSRISSPNAASASPIQVVSSAEIVATGKNDISDIINQLPQIINNDLGQDFSNRTPGLTSAGGLTTADLRGIGPNRTLVLIDGRRLGIGSPNTQIASYAPDLDQVPLPLVERVEVLTGGASSVYGSDAIAGVVNFILKKNFQGLQFDGHWGEDWHQQKNAYIQPLLSAKGLTPLSGSIQDGRSRNFSVVAGTNFADNSGNVTGYLTYLHNDPVASGDRDFGQCQLAEDFDPTTGNVIGNHCSGSSNANRFTPLTGPNAGTRYAVSGTSLVPWGTVATNPPAVFNSQPFIYMQREDDRYQAGVMAHVDYTDFAKPYFEVGFMNDKTHQAIAPTAAFFSGNPNTGGPYLVNCGNPFLSAQEQGILGCTAAQISGNQADPANQVPVVIGRRNVEGGARFSDYEHSNYRLVLGIKGELSKAWEYDAWGQYYYTTFFEANNQYFSYAKIDNALLATNTAAGPACVSGPPCVPWNIFSDGGVTQQALNYLYLLGTGAGNTTLRTAHADITGKLGEYGIRSPFANEGLGFNAGFEHRNENLTYRPDDAFQSGQLSGAGASPQPIDNSLGVSEGFIELRLPVAQDKPFVKDLLLGTGFRHSDYAVTGGINTYKFDLQFAPTEDLRLRGSIQHAIRAPSIGELFTPANIGLGSLGNDPCAPPATATLAQCLRTVPAADAAAFTALYGNGGSTDHIPQAVSGQLNQEQGGTLLLKPEKARSYSFGFLFSPRAIRNLTGSIDFWQIHLDGAIAPYPVSVIENGCLQNNDPFYCSLIVRTRNNGITPNTFSLQGATLAGGGYIVQIASNLASTLTSGIDLQTNCRVSLPAGAGSLSWGFNGAYLIHASTTPFSSLGSYDCAGLFGFTCQTVNPRWRHNLRTSWESPWNVDMSLNWRFIGKVGNDNNDPNPLLNGVVYGAYDSALRQLPNINYLDLSAAYHGWKGVDVRAGVNNLFDRDPPLVPVTIQPGGAANTYGMYEALGRQLYVSFTAKF